MLLFTCLSWFSAHLRAKYTTLFEFVRTHGKLFFLKSHFFHLSPHFYLHRPQIDV